MYTKLKEAQSFMPPSCGCACRLPVKAVYQRINNSTLRKLSVLPAGRSYVFRKILTLQNIISLNNSRLDFVTEAQCVFFEVRTKFLNII